MKRISNTFSTIKGLYTYLVVEKNPPTTLLDKFIYFYYIKGVIVSVKSKINFIEFSFDINTGK